MPIPKPRKNESQKAFIDRCMGDDVMNSEYPKTAQRQAVCQSQWDGKKKGAAMPGRIESEIKLDERLTFEAEPVEWVAAAGDGTGDPSVDKPKKFKMTAYTGGAMRIGYYSSPVVIDLSGLTVAAEQIPILQHHDIRRIVGHGGVEITTQTVKVSGEASGAGEAAEEVTASARRGFPWKASVGVIVHKTEFVDEDSTAKANGRVFDGPVNIVRSGTLEEVSFVPIAADKKTSASVAAGARHHVAKERNMPPEFLTWLEAKGFDAETLTAEQTATLEAAWKLETKPPEGGKTTPPPTSKANASASEVSLNDDGAGDGAGDGAEHAKVVAGAVDPKVLAQQIRDESRKAAAEEKRRQAEIHAVCSDHPEVEAKALAEIEAKALEEGWSSDQTELAVLRAGRAKPPAQQSVDREINAKAMESGLLLASGRFQEDDLVKRFGEKTIEAARRMGPMSIPAIFQHVLRANGRYSGRNFGDDTIREAIRIEKSAQIQAAGYSTVTVSGILGNVANKSLLAQYDAVPDVGRKIAATGSVKDFKQATRYRLTMTGSIEQVGATGELKHGSFDEESYTAQAKTYGKIVGLSREMIINDDLDAFTKIPRSLGRACAIGVEKAIFEKWLANTGSFFSNAHANIAASAGLTTDQTEHLAAAVLLFRSMVDANSDPIGIEPKYMLVPSSLEVYADQLYTDVELAVIGTAGSVTKRLKSNPHKGKFIPLATKWLETTSLSGYSTTTWYLVADPADVPAIEVVYLNGNQRPTIESSDVEFDRLGMNWRVYFDYGVGFQDYRAAVQATA